MQVNGAAGSPPSSWRCTNTTLDPSPAACQWSPFWSIPANASFAGHDSAAGTDRWVYWEGGDRCVVWRAPPPPAPTARRSFEFVATAASPPVPVRTAKLFGHEAGGKLWAIRFEGFVAGAPALQLFEPTQGVVCPPASEASAAL